MINLTKKNTFFILISFSLFLCFFINGLYSFTSSSEFWSITVSKYFFSTDSKWSSVYFKPLFNFLLSLFYFLPVSDLFHIQLVKFFFTLNGLIQIGLLFKILQSIKKNEFLNILISFCLFSSPFLISNYDRIRSDQLALTFFISFIYLSINNFKFQKYLPFVFLVFFPLIAFKHIYFSILTLFFIPFKSVFYSFKKLSFIRKFICFLIGLNLAVWILFFATKALPYFINSFHDFLSDLDRIKYIIRQESFFLGLSYLSLLIPHFRNYLKERKLFPFVWIQFPIICFLLIHPQKYNFFIASLLPLIFILSAFFILFLSEQDFKYSKVFNWFLIFSLAAILLNHLFYPTKSHRFLNLKNPQFEAIHSISSILSQHNLTYLDGMGLFPRQKTTGCFVSPDDHIANQSCIDSIQNKIPESILVTNRLLGLDYDLNQLSYLGYTAIGPNFYLRDDIYKHIKIEKQTWPIPSLIFTTEQIY